MEYFEAHIFTASKMRVIGSLVFLILPWFLLYFLYVLNETLSLLESLYLCIIASFNYGLSPLPLKISPFCFPTKNPKILFALQVKKKNTLKHIVYTKSEHNKFTKFAHRLKSHKNGFKSILLSIKRIKQGGGGWGGGGGVK